MCPQLHLELCFRDPHVIMSLLYQCAVFLVLIHTPDFLSFCHHRGFLTCADFAVVGLAHPVVALAERTVVFARLGHLADADSTLTPASATAQLPPWDTAPELRLRPGQPAGGRNTQPAPVRTAKRTSCGQSQGLQLGPDESLAHLKPPSCHWLQPTPRILFLTPLQLWFQIITCLKSPNFLHFYQKCHCYLQECLYSISLTFLTTLASSTFPSGIPGIYA